MKYRKNEAVKDNHVTVRGGGVKPCVMVRYEGGGGESGLPSCNALKFDF